MDTYQEDEIPQLHQIQLGVINVDRAHNYSPFDCQWIVADRYFKLHHWYCVLT